MLGVAMVESLRQRATITEAKSSCLLPNDRAVLTETMKMTWQSASLGSIEISL